MVARHIGTGGTYYMNDTGYIEGAGAASLSTARGPRRTSTPARDTAAEHQSNKEAVQGAILLEVEPAQ